MGAAVRAVPWHAPSRELGGAAVHAFLSHLANERNISVSTQRQAGAALLFLYEQVLGVHIEVSPGVARPTKPRRLPVVLTHDQIAAVFAELKATPLLVARMLYGSGIRISEALQLRLKDVDTARREITVRGGKSKHDRVTMLPKALVRDIERQIACVRKQHAADIARDAGWVQLPAAFATKSPGAARDLPWQWLFPATCLHTDATTGQLGRHHLHESAVQRAVTAAVRRAGITKRATCHSFRHSFGTHLIEAGYTSRAVQELMGHKNLRTTELYLHVLNRDRRGIVSPLDQLLEDR